MSASNVYETEGKKDFHTTEIHILHCGFNWIPKREQNEPHTPSM